MAGIAVPKNLTKACKLYLGRKYSEADTVMSKISEMTPHKAAVEAQLALFKNDFESAIEHCMLFLPHLEHWRSLNMAEAGPAMITFCANRTNNETVSAFLEKLKDDFSGTEKAALIPIVSKNIKIMNGEYVNKGYTPPEKPICLGEAAENLSKYRKGLTGETAEDAVFILSRAYNTMDCTEYLQYYEKYADVPTLPEATRFHAVEMYLHLNMPDKARQAVCDFYMHSWIPVEKTTIMPISMFTYDTRLWELFDAEFFDFIYQNPAVHFSTDK